MGRGYNSGLNRQLRVNRDNYSVEPIYTYFTHCTYYAGTTTPSSTSPPRSSSVPRPASITTSYTPEPVELHTAPTAPCAHRCAARRSCASACGSCLSHRSSSAWYRSRCSNPITLTLNPTLTTNSSPSPNPNQPSPRPGRAQDARQRGCLRHARHLRLPGLRRCLRAHRVGRYARSTYLASYRSVDPSIHPSINPSIYLSIYLYLGLRLREVDLAPVGAFDGIKSDMFSTEDPTDA